MTPLLERVPVLLTLSAPLIVITGEAGVSEGVWGTKGVEEGVFGVVTGSVTIGLCIVVPLCVLTVRSRGGAGVLFEFQT